MDFRVGESVLLANGELHTIEAIDDFDQIKLSNNTWYTSYGELLGWDVSRFSIVAIGDEQIQHNLREMNEDYAYLQNEINSIFGRS